MTWNTAIASTANDLAGFRNLQVGMRTTQTTNTTSNAAARIIHAMKRSKPLLGAPEPTRPPMNRLREARQALGWTQHDLAYRAGVSMRSVRFWEHGTTPTHPSPPSQRKLLHAFGLEWEQRVLLWPARVVRGEWRDGVWYSDESLDDRGELKAALRQARAKGVAA